MADLPHSKYTELFYWLIVIPLLSIGPTRCQYIDTVVHATASNCTPISVWGEKEVGEGRGRREEKGGRRAIVSCLTFFLCCCCSLFKLLLCSVLIILELFDLLWRRYFYACVSHCCHIFRKLPSSILHKVWLWCIWVPRWVPRTPMLPNWKKAT